MTTPEATAGAIRQALAPLQRHPLFSAKVVAIQDNRVTENDVDEWLAALALAAGNADSSIACDSIEHLGGTPAHWTRLRTQLFPVLIEKLTILPDSDFAATDTAAQFRIESPGVWQVASSEILSPAKGTAQWLASWRDALAATPGGLALCTLELPPGDTGLELRPLVLHALRPDGGAVDRGFPDSQKSITNAFWQTFWATGARRSERGIVFPVAFLPIDRTWPGEFRGPFRERYVSLRRRLFGRTSIIAHYIEILTRQKALLFDVPSSRFGVSSQFESEQAAIPADDLALALHELNRTGFVDAWTGANRDLFASWADREASAGPGNPWAPPPTTDVPRFDPTAPGVHAIRRVVPFSGTAYLSEVVSRTADLIARGKIQDFDGEILAATNSNFFLNFPEEYASIHSAMNDPVALLVESGRTLQARTMRRAAFVTCESGEALITTDAGLRLESEVLLFEGESSSATYFTRAREPFSRNSFGPLFFGSVIVGNSIVETFEETTTEIPANGWAIGDSEAFGGDIEPERVISTVLRSTDGTRDLSIRHAFAVGPLLLRDGAVVPLGESAEEFQTLIADAAPSAEETAHLSRTQLPAELLNCAMRGVPPTRFPYDWNQTRAPRTALGIKPDGTILLAVVDGRADLVHSVGVTLAELAAVMHALGCRDAMNLDGGGSSVMFIHDPAAAKYKLRDYLADGLVTLPSDPGGIERLLPVPLVLCRRPSA